MKKFKSMKWILVALSIIMVLLPGCSNKVAAPAANTQPEKELTKVDKIKKAGKLVIGTSAGFPPFEFHKEINGKDTIVGIDLLIAEQIAKDLGVKLEVKDMDFKGLLSALQSNNIDLVLAGMSATEERKQSVDFSKIYFQGNQGILIKKDQKDKLKTLADLKGKKIGVQKASIQVNIAKNQIENADVKELNKIPDLILGLKGGNVDAVILDAQVAGSYASKNEDLLLANIQLQQTTAGMAAAINKGNSDLVQAVNKTLDRLFSDKSIEKFTIESQELADK
jgi:arginine/lysine/histidine transporter system substrate-binding protein